ncbi:MAG: 1-aminocyclopropane-1-carboxylate deaminase [Pseudohongiellaceae bacterium]
MQEESYVLNLNIPAPSRKRTRPWQVFMEGERMQELELATPPVNQINCELLAGKAVSLRVLRLDKIHPHIHGNKWFKLKLNLRAAQEQGHSRLISFGGAYSNHLYALAAAGSYFGLETIGIVRGELIEPLNPVLAFCRSSGMTLRAISRTDYRRKEDLEFLQELTAKYGPAYVIPEGGSNALAFAGCREIADMACSITGDSKATIAMACGTGATMTGVIEGLQILQAPHSVLGVSVLNAKGMIADHIESGLNKSELSVNVPWYVSDSFHCGGYAKRNLELSEFIEGFAEISDIPIEPVYTAKLLFGLFSMIEADAFPRGAQIIALHTGGIVGVDEGKGLGEAAIA